MQFKHPFILFALFLLALPIIVHFFQLQKFIKVPFTNVKFLKNIILQNRQSSKLKKLLVLISRLLLLTFLILAFSEPFLSKNKVNKKVSTIIFLDNSYSMQTKNKDLSLFTSAIQELIKQPLSVSKITLVTNNKIYKNLTLKSFKIQLSKLKLSPNSFDLDNALLHISNLASEFKGHTQVLLISDFQRDSTKKKNVHFNPEVTYTLVNLKSKKNDNISIDSIYISDNNTTNFSLNVLLKSHNSNIKNISVSLFKDNLLVAKSTVKSFKNKRAQTKFNLESTASFKGTVKIEDSNLKYDNKLFFVISKVNITNVLVIGAYNKTIEKLYNNLDFKLKESTIENLDFTLIEQQHVIILNEIGTISNLLSQALKSFSENGGTLIIIPKNLINLSSYTQFFKKLGLNGTLKKVILKNKITGINYNHPLLKNVFEKQVINFDYPSTQFHYQLKAPKSSSILKFDDNTAFISQFKLKNSKLFFVATPLEIEVNTFENSPLIVPLFYNMAMQNDLTNMLYYNLARQNSIALQANLKKDEVLTLSNNITTFIPQQHIKQHKVIIETDTQPDKPGFYTVKQSDLELQNLAFNINRKESEFMFYSKADFTKNKNIAYFTDLSKAQLSFKNNTSIFELWKLFMALALLFFLIEILLLKHLKT